jgi:hypothetical protein
MTAGPTSSRLAIVEVKGRKRGADMLYSRFPDTNQLDPISSLDYYFIEL